MKSNINFIFLISLLFLFGCSKKIIPPESVPINENIVAKKTFFSEEFGCTIYVPHSKVEGAVQQVIYFVYFENEKFVVRGDADSKNCL